MRSILTKKNIAIVLIAVVITSVAAFSVGTGRGQGFISEWMGKLSGPMRSASASVARTFETIYGFMYEHENVVAENEELKGQIADFRQDYREYTEVSEENKRLRELLGFSARHSDFIYEPATILSWSASNWSSSFTISRGETNSEIKVDDPVITESGVLIGRITEVGKTTSIAVSVIDTTFSSGALAGEPGVLGVAEGDFALMGEGRLKLDFLEDNTTVLAGDAVVTSGKGGIFPEGLVIGTVEAVMANPAGIGMYGIIEPEADLNSSTYVYVITHFDRSL